MKPISVQRFPADVRMRLTVPASSPSASSGELGRVLSIMAKAKTLGPANRPVVNSAAREAASGQGPGGMWEKSSGCLEETRWKVGMCFTGSNGVSLISLWDSSRVGNGKVEVDIWD